MKRGIFTTAQAHLVSFPDHPKLVNLQIHQWKEQNELIRLKRGVYMFSDAQVKEADVAKTLYEPCYFSLEYALSLHGIMPEAVFTYTLVTPKPTRSWQTPVGTFSFRTIKREAFTGFDPDTLIAEKEKALVDYFYLNSAKLQTTHSFWEESRLEVIETHVDFEKAAGFAKLFRSKKLDQLLSSLQNYAKSS